MTDLSQMSDDELLAAYAMPQLIKQESGGRAGIVGPQTRYGRAEGMTQMLPATAQATAERLGLPWRPELMRGSDQEAADYQQQLGQAYLQEGIQKTGSLDGGLRYYHGGPDQRQWGPKTNAYAQAIQGRLGGAEEAQDAPSSDLSQMSDEDLLAAYNAPQQVAQSQGGGVTIDVAPAAPAPAPLRGPVKAAPPVPQEPNPTIAQDAWSGFTEPFKALGHDVMEGYRKSQNPSIPTSPLDAAKRFGSNVMDTTRVLGDVLGLTGAPMQAVVRPVARAVNRTGVPLYGRQSFSDAVSGKAPVKLDGAGRQASIENTINTALSAAKPATERPVAVPRPQAKSVEALREAKNAAYQAVDDMGVAYSPNATAKLADTIGYDLATKHINPRVTPKAHALMEDIQTALKSGNPVTMTDLDQLRQAVSLATGKGDDAEKYFGSAINGHIDDFVDNAGPAQVVNGDAEAAGEALRAAREANKRYRKTQLVTNEVESASLRSSSTYAGGNKANAIRQELRPLIDPTSQKRIRNLTPKETKAIKRVVDGSGGANAWRVAGKLLDPRGLLGATVQTTMGLPTHGLSAASVPIGMLSSEMSNRATNKAVEELLKVLSVGETAKQAPKIPLLTLAGRPGPSLLSPAGLTGAAEVAAPLARLPSERPSKADAKRDKGKQPQRR